MHLVQVPPDAVGAIWPRVEGYFTRALEHARGTHTLEAMKHGAVSGQRQLWIVVDDAPERNVVAAGETSLQIFPSGKKVLQIEAFAGDNMKQFFSLKDDLEKWAKEQEGCDGVFLWARKGWVKHLTDYSLTHYLMYKDL